MPTRTVAGSPAEESSSAVRCASLSHAALPTGSGPSRTIETRAWPFAVAARFIRSGRASRSVMARPWKAGDDPRDPGAGGAEVLEVPSEKTTPR